MASKKPASHPPRTAKPSPAWEKTGIARLYKRVGKQRISWIYKHMNGRSETLASAVLGDRAARYDAERLAAKLAVEIQQGVVVAGAVSEMIERFELKEDPTYYELNRERQEDPEGDVRESDEVFWAYEPRRSDDAAWLPVLRRSGAASAPVKGNPLAKAMLWIQTVSATPY